MKEESAKAWRARFWLLAVLALVLLAPTFAGAQGGGTSQKLKAIRKVMEQGQGLYIAKQYEQAAKVFQDGYAKHPYSAFLFNSGVCFTKLKRVDDALAAFRKYVSVDPTAPDIENVRERIKKLEAAKAPPTPVSVADAGEGGVPEGGAVAPTDAGPPSIDVGDDDSAMRSLVVIETEPSGAPLKLYRRMAPNAAPFAVGGQNAGWKEVAGVRAPANVTLGVGTYHIVVDKFRDFNVSETDIEVAPGRVLHFKANLSQGKFMGFLRVSSNVRGAYIYLNDRDKKRPEWGTTPYAEMVPTGEHDLLVEAPGFQPFAQKVTLKNGEQKEIEVQLSRVDYGILRIKPRLTGKGGSAKIRIDEQPLGTWQFGEAPFETRVASGRHRLTVEADGHKEYDGMIDVPKGQVLPVTVTMIPSYPRGAAWTQAVVGALFIGAAAYLGNESNRLHDEIKDDRKRGVLQEDDGRIKRGRIFAISADAGFAVGGVLAILATYNFIKDPYPESASNVDKPVEFDDPRKQRPTAAGPRKEFLATRRRSDRKKKERRSPAVRVGPSFTSRGGGLIVGGSF